LTWKIAIPKFGDFNTPAFSTFKKHRRAFYRLVSARSLCTEDTPMNVKLNAFGDPGQDRTTGANLNVVCMRADTQ
jgi:hypothetical protein